MNGSYFSLLSFLNSQSPAKHSTLEVYLCGRQGEGNVGVVFFFSAYDDVRTQKRIDYFQCKMRVPPAKMDGKGRDAGRIRNELHNRWPIATSSAEWLGVWGHAYHTTHDRVLAGRLCCWLSDLLCAFRSCRVFFAPPPPSSFIYSCFFKKKCFLGFSTNWTGNHEICSQPTRVKQKKRRKQVWLVQYYF